MWLSNVVHLDLDRDLCASSTVMSLCKRSGQLLLEVHRRDVGRGGEREGAVGEQTICVTLFLDCVNSTWHARWTLNTPAKKHVQSQTQHTHVNKHFVTRLFKMKREKVVWINGERWWKRERRRECVWQGNTEKERQTIRKGRKWFHVVVRSPSNGGKIHFHCLMLEVEDLWIKLVYF